MLSGSTVLMPDFTNGRDGAPYDAASSSRHIPFDPAAQQVDFNEFTLFGTDRLSDAWFGQHLMNLDWMDYAHSP